MIWCQVKKHILAYILFIYFSRRLIQNCQPHTVPPTTCKIKVIDRFGDKKRVNSSNFNSTVLKFSEKFVHPFSQVFMFGNMSPKSYGFVAEPVTRSNNFVSDH